jgi:hypothetical protein
MSLDAVVCFLPGRAKDLPARQYIYKKKPTTNNLHKNYKYNPHKIMYIPYVLFYHSILRNFYN